MYVQELTLNNQQGLMCRKTTPSINQKYDLTKNTIP